MSAGGAPRAEVGRFQTIEQFIIEQQRRVPGATGGFTRLIGDISIAAKIVNRDIRRAGLLDVLGDSGEINVQGETQQKLDAIAHAEYVQALRLGGVVSLIVSEEADNIIPLEQEGEGRYVVYLDPLDGSTNLDVNVSVGTIFSVYRLPAGTEPSLAAALLPGTEQVAAGYVVYGSSTMMVYTAGSGVHGFTLDPQIGEFLLSHPDMRMPPTGIYYSVNEGNTHSFSPAVAGLIASLHRADPASGLPYTSRYVGSFIADFHRTLLKGGIYMYPATSSHPDGKLRLMYEANPMAMIAEQAGGLASTGRGRVLEIRPKSAHQRTPLFIGSAEMVRHAEEELRRE